MKKQFTFSLLILIVWAAQAQYIAQTYNYIPAPGQFINSTSWGTPSNAQSIIGGVNGRLSLGAYGGSVIFSFETPVENHPDHPFGVDFTIFANAQTDWCEPGVVHVMVDENNNGAPDDTWYELAGSDYYFSTSSQNHSVTYFNPHAPNAENVPWTDNTGAQDSIYANFYHNQPYYPLSDSFPEIPENQYTLSGSYITLFVDSVSTPYTNKTFKRAFGYADNQLRGTAPYTIPDNPYTAEVENTGCDSFDISWAVDETGTHVQLEQIDFIKVTTATMANAGILGEISCDLTGAAKVEPNPDITGELNAVVIRDLPPKIETGTYPMQAIQFYKGIPTEEQNIAWSCNLPDCFVDDDNMLHANSTGQLKITASLVDHPEVSFSILTNISSGNSVEQLQHQNNIKLFPNPVTDYFTFSCNETGILEIYTISGHLVLNITIKQHEESIDISHFARGLYLVHFTSEFGTFTKKIVKQ